MKKTIKQWLEELPDGYRERVLKGSDDLTTDELEETSKSMNDAILCSIDWSSSEEGFDFWDAVYDHYRIDTPLPELPE
jgi:hypothetical protein